MGNQKRARQKANKAHNSKSDEDSQSPQKKSKNSKWNISYAAMTIEQAEQRLGIQLDKVKAVRVDTMISDSKVTLEKAGVDKKAMEVIKDKVYDRIVEYLDIEGYPTEASLDFKEANVSDLVLFIVSPIIHFIQRNMGRKIRLRREREIISVDGETGGNEEFVVVDEIAVGYRKFVLIIEAKRSSTGQAMKQMMLSLKDASDNNNGGTVYGFITTGQIWQMLRYDGASFNMTAEIMGVFYGMDEDKDRWMKECSVLVDCLYVALLSGGIVKDVVVSAG